MEYQDFREQFTQDVKVKLTDNVYHYDSKEHIFELAESFETRQMEKDTITSTALLKC